MKAPPQAPPPATGKQRFRRVAQGLFVANPSGKYYTIFRKGGKMFRQSLKTSDEKLALRRLQKAMEDLLKLKSTLARATFSKILEMWRKTEFAAMDLKKWSRKYRETCIKGLQRSWPDLADTRVRDITRGDCERWLALRRTQVSAGLLNNELGTLKMVLAFAVREGATMENVAAPLKRAKVSTAKIIIPTKAQFESLVRDMQSTGNDPGANFVELLGYSGMRREEAAQLRWRDIDFDQGRFAVTGGEQGTKNREVRHPPLFPSLRQLLERLASEQSHTPEDTVMKIQQCHMGISRACQRLKLPHFNHHAMRHFFCSNAIENGVDFKAIAGWVGHKDGGMLVAKTYGHLRQEHSEAMAAKMTFSVKPESSPTPSSPPEHR